MPAAAPTVKLNNGATLPLIGLGTWKSGKGEVQAAVYEALKCGYRHIDGAAAYGNESEVGAGVAQAIAEGICTRADIFLTSKLWHSKCAPAPGGSETTAEMVAAALAATLKDLQTDYVDLYLVHWPFFTKPGSAFPPTTRDDVLGYSEASYLAVWRELEKAVDGGRARAIGTSNVSAKKLAALLRDARIPPAVNQVESHPFLPQLRLKKFCDDHHIVLEAYSPLGSPDRPARLVDEADPVPLADPVVAAVAAKHGASAAAVLLRWQTQRGVVALPKSTTPSRIAANLDVFGFSLDAADLAALAALGERPTSRIVKGLPLMVNGQEHWASHWDEEWELEHVKL